MAFAFSAVTLGSRPGRGGSVGLDRLKSASRPLEQLLLLRLCMLIRFSCEEMRGG